MTTTTYTPTTYTLDLSALTVLVRHADGSVDDLNATGEPCETLDDLRAFVTTLREQGCYDAELEAELLASAE